MTLHPLLSILDIFQINGCIGRPSNLDLIAPFLLLEYMMEDELMDLNQPSINE